jgi:hypothetical protein
MKMKSFTRGGAVPRRKSKNIQDIREPGKAKLAYDQKIKKNDMALDHTRQIFRKGDTDILTKVANTISNKDRLKNSERGLKGAQAMKSPAKKVLYNKFSSKGR